MNFRVIVITLTTFTFRVGAVVWDRMITSPLRVPKIYDFSNVPIGDTYQVFEPVTKWHQETYGDFFSVHFFDKWMPYYDVHFVSSVTLRTCSYISTTIGARWKIMQSNYTCHLKNAPYYYEDVWVVHNYSSNVRDLTYKWERWPTTLRFHTNYTYVNKTQAIIDEKGAANWYELRYDQDIEVDLMGFQLDERIGRIFPGEINVTIDDNFIATRISVVYQGWTPKPLAWKDQITYTYDYEEIHKDVLITYIILDSFIGIALLTYITYIIYTIFNRIQKRK